jgi:ABC-type branched-subunit amino acid transport system substrate-binding protein
VRPGATIAAPSKALALRRDSPKSTHTGIDPMRKRRLIKKSIVCLGASMGLCLSAASMAADTIKVGILQSLSGTMAISETTLKDTILMLIDEQNKKGGLLGWNYFMRVEDPANEEFIKTWQAFIEDPNRVTNDPMEAHYIGF